MSIMHGNKGLI